MSKNERLFEAIGEVGEDLICEAEYHRFASPWRRWSSAAAAVLVVVVAAAMVLPLMRLTPKEHGAPEAAPKDVYVGEAGNEMPAEEAASGETPEEAPAETAVEEAPAEEPAEGPAPEPEEEAPLMDDPEDTDEIDPEESVEDNRDDKSAFTGPVETEADFWALFPELDMQSMVDYMDTHPGLAENGWSQVVVNEAGLDQEGTEIRTTNGDQVLAIDVPNRILLVRVSGETVTEEMKSEQPVTYQGVLAIAKDPGRLTLETDSRREELTETLADIAQAHNGVLAINASAYMGTDGSGPYQGVEAGKNNGWPLIGYAMSNGQVVGEDHMVHPFQRLELHEDNTFHILPAEDPVSEKTTDAMECNVAPIIDGVVQTEAMEGYDGIHPRSLIGQRENGEVLMLVIEGRMPGYSEGTDLSTCAEILQDYGAWQAMALDYGTSSILWYDGQYVTKCSVEALPEGRPLPNAFVYSRKGG